MAHTGAQLSGSGAQLSGSGAQLSGSGAQLSAISAYLHTSYLGAQLSASQLYLRFDSSGTENRDFTGEKNAFHGSIVDFTGLAQKQLISRACDTVKKKRALPHT